MGFFNRFRSHKSSASKLSGHKPAGLISSKATVKRRRIMTIEQLEQRQMLAGDGFVPDDVLLGGVYFEEATGDDTEGDVIQVSFVGGAPGTTLDRISINTDKNNDGFSIGDVFFDTASGGRGDFSAVPLEILSSEGFEVTGVSIEDGGTLIVFDLVGFEAGELLQFSVDVDEYQGDNPETGEPSFNALVEGAEFQFSQLVGDFSAPGFVDLQLSGRFYDFFDARRDTAEAETELELDLPNDRFEAADNKIDRTAGAVDHAPLIPLASISGYVYHDRSDDGQFDDDEDPIAGVTIELLDENGDPTGRTTTTDEDGFYKFDNLFAGKYGVREIHPDGWFDGKDTAGTHDGLATNDLIVGAMLGFGDDGLFYNFGELLPGSIAGVVHVSDDADCDFDNPDTLLEGVRIDLLDAQGNFIRSTTTDANGRYKFDGLRPGEYQVREVQPEQYFDGGERAGTAGGNVADDLITGIVIGSEQDAVNYDFCEHIGAMLSGYVYHDKSDDGSFDDGENPIEGVELKLLLDDGTDTGLRAITDANGFYKFNDLAPGEYCVMENHPEGWYDGKDTAGSLGGVVTDDMICEININFGDNSINNNFGELLPGSIAGRVHASNDPDCDFDNPDILLEGVQIDLLDANGNVIRSTTTDAEGRYKFDDLEPGSYGVREHQPEGYYDGGERLGTAAGTLANDLITNITIGSEQHATQYDFCEHVGAMLSGYVYHDRSDDGSFDDNEDPIENVEIKLLNGDGSDTGLRTFTDADGFYKFNNLDAGKYNVMEVHPSGWFDGKDTAGTGGGDVTNDMISQIMLMYGGNSINNNFGELLAGSIAGRVHASNDADCDFDDPDILLEGVQIDLLDANGNLLATTTTDAEGRYKFDGLQPGEYQVREHQPSDYFDGGERTGTAGGELGDDLITGIQLGSEQHAVNYDFCEHVGAMISGYVYHDRSDDGSFDSGEDPIAGVELKLLLADGTDTGRRAVTDANGFYKFNDLAPGEYCVMENHPENWLDGKDTAGSHGGDVTNDMICAINIDFGDNATEYNFGELLPGSISGRVHVSPDPDCEDHEEADPLEGVLIELLNEAGEVISTTRTNAAGEYSFTDLVPGKYGIREVQPTAYFDGNEHIGTGGGELISNDTFVGIEVGSDEHFTQYDFCETPPASLAGYVFIDGAPIVTLDDLTPEEVAAVRNGQRTLDDTPLETVTLELRDGITGRLLSGSELLPGAYPDGPVITTTDANGFYEFNNLPPGVYSVVEAQPEGLIDGVDTVGTEGGFAINPANAGGSLNEGVLTPDEDRMINNFRQQFGSDVIFFVRLEAGDRSVENNFSEVRTLPFLPPPLPPEVLITPPPVFASPNFVPPQPLLPLRIVPNTPEPIFGGSSRALGYTWHLSVVNAGWPRAMETNGASMQAARERLNVQDWQEVSMDRAQWTLLEDDERSDKMQQFVFGNENGIPVAGDWNGDGITDIGVYVDGYWYLDLNGNGQWDKGDMMAHLGSRDDRPVTGDWDADGKTDIGIFGPAWPQDPTAIARDPGLPDADNYPTHPSEETPFNHEKNMPPVLADATSGGRALRRTIQGEGRTDVIDHVFNYGVPGDIPIAGDWNGDGIRTIGVFRDGTWTLDTDGDGRLTDIDESFAYGAAGDLPVVGDWNGDGIEELGIFHNGHWVVDTNNDRTLDARDTAFELGGAGDKPIVGDWNGDGVSEPGAYGPRGFESQPEIRVSQKAG